MADAITAAGAVKGQSRYAALNMGGEQFTGLWTAGQRSAYRDAATPYIQKKFYQANRFDSIIDGINREISQRLTTRRRPGSSIYNSNIFPAANSMKNWKYIQNNAEVVRVIYDGVDGNIYDATAGQKSTLFSKSAGASAARFLGVNTELFFTDGVENKKIVQSAFIWGADEYFEQGTFIVDSNKNLQVAWGGITVNISSVQVTSNVLTLTLDPNDPNLPDNLLFLVGMKLTASGLTSATFLNSQTFTIASVVQGNPETSSHILTASFTHANYGPAPDTGSVTSGTGISGSTAPSWGSGKGTWTYGDGGQQWLCGGSNIQNWGSAAPTTAPSVSFATKPNPYNAWAANTYYGVAQYPVVLDNNGIQACTTAGAISGGTPTFSGTLGGTTTWGTAVFTNVGTGNWTAATLFNTGTYATNPVGIYNYLYVCIQSGVSGASQAIWLTSTGAIVYDNDAVWLCLGIAVGSIATVGSPTVETTGYIVDSNGYLQAAQVMAGLTGATEPTWSEIVGNTTSDTASSDNQSWLNSGNFEAGGTAPATYAYSFASSITGFVSTSSPASTPRTLPPDAKIIVQGFGSTDTQIDTIYIWATTQGGSTLLFLDKIPAPSAGASGTWSYIRVQPIGVNEDSDLNAFIAAPIDDANDPPQIGMTAPTYYLQRVWAIVENKVVWSGGPDTLVGSGDESFPPLNFIPFIAQPICTSPITVQNGGLLVFTTDGSYIILGTGTSTNPFYATPYYSSVSISGYNAVAVYNNTVFLMESNGMVSSIAAEYPFNPQSGYTEVGFPVGDQFLNVNTGGINTALYNPATAYLSWNRANTQDWGMYVADGAVGWFKMSVISPPESGLVWSTRAAIYGGTSAVQDVEVAAGEHRLLIAPAVGTTGPILQRDTTGTVWGDWSATNNAYEPYPSWDAKGVNLLCATGQWAEVSHISTKSVAVGARPTISILLNEIEPSTDRPYLKMQVDDMQNDPAITLPSKSVYSNRYVALAGDGLPTQGDCLLTKFDYGSQQFADELLDWGIYASVTDEREEPVAR